MASCRCIKIMLGITNRQRWVQHITMPEVRKQWGNLVTRKVNITKRKFEWLGHLTCMPDCRTPKPVFFGWLTRPRGDPRRRWKDLIRKDLKEMDVDECKWYEEACRSKSGWREIYKLGVENSVEQHRTAQTSRQPTAKVVREMCLRQFSREWNSDKKNKLISEHQNQYGNNEV